MIKSFFIMKNILMPEEKAKTMTNFVKTNKGNNYLLCFVVERNPAKCNINAR
jgi:hypothetical protein